MASNIEFLTIDEGFPVAGVDNNSQGFRDNFSIIRTSLGDAKTEITDLQDNAARKDEDNDFANNSLIRVNLDSMTLTYLAGSIPTEPTAEPTELNIGNGYYQSFSTNSNVTFTLAGWPNQNLATVFVELIGANTTPHVVSIVGENSGNFVFTGPGFESTSNATTLKIDITSNTDPKVIELWSYDNGATVYAKVVGSFNESAKSTLVMPSYTTIERDNTYTSPTTGTVIFNTTTSTFQGYNGTAWVDMTA